jgi:hypothetical protein
MVIQFLLVGAMLVLFAVFIARAHTVNAQAAKRIGFLLFVAGNCYAILRPQDVTWVANRVGVGRGTDLVLYILVIGFAFFAVNTYLRFRALERRFTDLARAVALGDAVPPEQDTETAAAPLTAPESTGSPGSTGSTGTEAGAKPADSRR